MELNRFLIAKAIGSERLPADYTNYAHPFSGLILPLVSSLLAGLRATQGVPSLLTTIITPVITILTRVKTILTQVIMIITQVMKIITPVITIITQVIMIITQVITIIAQVITIITPVIPL
jgi:phage-related protein